MTTNDHLGRRQPASARRASRARRALLCLLTGTVAGGLAVLTLPGAPAGAATAKSGLDIELTRVSPAAVGPTTPLVVSGVARNLGGSAVKKPTVTLRLHQGLLDGREGVDDWIRSGPLTTADLVLPGKVKLKTLAPNQITSFTVTVPAGQLTGLSSLSSFGPRGMTLDATAGGKSVGTLRSTFVWMPGEPTVRTRLSLAVPLVEAGPSTAAGAATEDAARSLEPGGHLDRVLTATGDKAVAWAVDPSVLQAARSLAATGVTTEDDVPTATTSDNPDATGSSSPSPTGTSGTQTADPVKQAANTWLSRFRTGAQNRGLIGLPYADPDLTAILRAKESEPLLTSADELGAQAADDAAGVRLDNSIAWPAAGRINTVTASRLADNGRTAVILSGATQPPAEATTTTPTGRGTVETKSGSLDSLLYDDQLSALFAASGDTTAGAAATQTFLSELAAVTRESSSVRHLLAVAPRAWDPNPGGVQALISALKSAPWISLRGINELRSTDPATARTTVKYGSKAKSAELPIGHVSAVLAMQRDLSTFAPALSVAPASDKTARATERTVVRTRADRVASLLSVAWRSDRDELVNARDDVRDDVSTLTNGVRLRGAKSATITGKTVVLQLVVDNRTAYPVNVTLRLKPASGQLAFSGDITVTAPARTRLPVQVPTRGLANGNVAVEAKLLTSVGGQVGPSLNFTVKVRPNWETVGMIVVGSFLGLLLVLGLLRGIRRGGRRGRVHPDNVPDVDDQASERADTASIAVADIAGDTREGDSDADPAISSTDGLSRPDPDSARSDEERRPAIPRETR